MAYRARGNGVRKTAATIMVGAIVAVIVLAAGQFLGWFKDTTTVILHASRAGLVMNPDAKVQLRGVTVGRVAEVKTDGDRAELVLHIDSGQMSRIPANIGADIKSNTVFGAKAVNLVVPADGGHGSLAAGDEISADHVVVELNTVYQQLVGLLAQTEPDKLNVVLGAVDDALSGKGKQIGDAVVQLTEILGKTNKHLPELNRLFDEAADATNVYADVMPDLMRTVDNATVVGNTLVENSANLDRLLINVSGMARSGNGVLSTSKKDLMSTLSDLNPVMDLLGYQSPGLRCFITGASDAADIAGPLLGGRNGMLLLDAGLIPGQDPYRYPQDLPEVGGDGPPTCQGGLSDIHSTEKIPFYVIDNAEQPYQPRTTPKVQSNKLFNLLFGGTPRG
ncbi:MCE family protein [Gordonia humi]|uniref:Phospholipid/cholesterol/gamma-HCH transport system substrate-binding protein n=1 Tax=Gordonia humi TaxID=686429 RepID=A0A840F4P3_9ACTN|nr:MCE family protein [Gordonia humi]MBB4134527.1 phospholipid/cholesterol/gamma-HCH transport system substrate-binding protein [Gordonia humi]